MTLPVYYRYTPESLDLELRDMAAEGHHPDCRGLANAVLQHLADQQQRIAELEAQTEHADNLCEAAGNALDALTEAKRTICQLKADLEKAKRR